MKRIAFGTLLLLSACSDPAFVPVPTMPTGDAAADDGGTSDPDAGPESDAAAKDAAVDAGPTRTVVNGPTDGSKNADQLCSASKAACDPTHVWSAGDGTTGAAACLAEYVDELGAHQWKRYGCAETAPSRFVKNQHTNNIVSLSCACVR
jgi:hypothetical protein